MVGNWQQIECTHEEGKKEHILPVSQEDYKAKFVSKGKKIPGLNYNIRSYER